MEVAWCLVEPESGIETGVWSMFDEDDADELPILTTKSSLEGQESSNPFGEQ